MAESRLPNLLALVEQVKPQFEQLAVIHKAVNWIEEASFAKRALKENDFLAGIAAGNPDSLKFAILDAASTGISLNPNKQHAALVPRKVRGKMKVCFEPMWRGRVQQAVDIGAIQWCVPSLVYEHDKIEYQGLNNAPIHHFDMFGDRGRLKGVYSISCLTNGSLIIDHMSIDEVNKIRDNTDSWKAYREKGSSSPWVTHYEEMVKKTMVKRASKNWPMKDNRVAALNELEGESEPKILLAPTPEAEDPKRQDLYLKIRTALDILERTEAKYCTYLKRLHGRDVKRIEDLTTIELEKSFNDLNQMIDQQTNKEQK